VTLKHENQREHCPCTLISLSLSLSCAQLTAAFEQQIGKTVVLTPYKAIHVAKYHEWMTSPFLQEMTASEPLSIEEEYDMQTSWHVDADSRHQ